MTILKAFGDRAKEIAHSADRFVNCAEIAKVYVEDTINGPGQADYDLKQAVKDLRRAADALEGLDQQITAMRVAAQTESMSTYRIPVYAVGY